MGTVTFFDPANTDDASSTTDLGTVVQADYPVAGIRCMFRYVKVVDIAAGVGDVMVMASAKTWDVTLDRAGGSAIQQASSSEQMVVGVMVGSVSLNQYGWMLVSGIHRLVKSTTTVLVGERLVAHATNNGECTQMAGGTNEDLVFGYAIQAEASGTCVVNVRCL